MLMTMLRKMMNVMLTIECAVPGRTVLRESMNGAVSSSPSAMFHFAFIHYGVL